jgi:gluconate 2-dehydrogenase gamma chain
MKEYIFPRRRFLNASVSQLGAAWVALHWPAILAAQEHAHHAVQSSQPSGFQFFLPRQATEIEAVAAQIIPSDDTPGAREAKTIYFIDRALTTFDCDKQAIYAQGLQDLHVRAKAMFAPADSFSQLLPEQQMQLLTAIEKTDFFETVRVHTVMGFLSNPEYSGNSEQTGWKLIGFQNRPFHQPPFGYYDAEYNRSK